MSDADATERLDGTVVLVHGGWGHPDDWQWVRAPLDGAGLTVIAVDLPSHNGPEPGLAEDGAFVRDTLEGANRPVVGVGWSYGGGVLCQAAAMGLHLDHLILLGSVPMPLATADNSWIDTDPHIQSFPDGRYVLDGTWWLDEAEGAELPQPVRTELRRIGRRPTNRNTLTEVDGDDWLHMPVTVMYGEDDYFVAPEEREWVASRFDVRAVTGDHFVLFRTPEVVSDLVLEVMRGLDR